MTGPDAAGPGALDQDYAQAGFGQRLGFGRRPVVLVVDMVNAYLDPASPLYAGVESSVAATVRLLAGARDAGVPVVFTKVLYGDGEREGGLFFRKARGLSLFVGDSEAGQVAAALERRDSEPLLTKRFASAFFQTPLTALLEEHEVDTVLIAGLSTSGCVRASAVDAIQLGFAPMVVRDAVGDRDPAPHEAALFDLDAKYADVVGLDEALTYLASSGVAPFTLTATELEEI